MLHLLFTHMELHGTLCIAFLAGFTLLHCLLVPFHCPLMAPFDCYLMSLAALSSLLVLQLLFFSSALHGTFCSMFLSGFTLLHCFLATFHCPLSTLLLSTLS